MRRLVFVIVLVYLAFALLLFLDDGGRSDAAACGAPPPTATPGPPTATPIPPTASPAVYPTVDPDSLPNGKAPAGLHAIAACNTSDQVVSALRLLVDLLDGWELVPIGKGPPPGMILVVFEDPSDSERTIALSILGDDSPTNLDGGAAQNIAREHHDELTNDVSIATDGELVWMRYERDGRSHLTWGAFGGARRFSIVAEYRADINMIADAWARATEHACYPDCR